MTELVLSFKSKRNGRSMLASSFRLHEIKQMLAKYGEDVSYVTSENNHVVEIILSPTLSEEKDKEISTLLADYFDHNYNKLYTYPDIAKEMEYTNGEG
mgnify:CR=1 FL=1